MKLQLPKVPAGLIVLLTGFLVVSGLVVYSTRVLYEKIDKVEKVAVEAKEAVGLEKLFVTETPAATKSAVVSPTRGMEK